MPPLIKIEVTPDIAAKIRFMAESGVFALKKGMVTLNFDASELKSIKTEIYTYPQKISTKPEVDIKEISLIV